SEGPRLHAESGSRADPWERARRQEHVARVPHQMDHPTWRDLACDRRQPEGDLLGIVRRVRTRTSYGRGELRQRPASHSPVEGRTTGMPYFAGPVGHGIAPKWSSVKSCSCTASRWGGPPRPPARLE